MQAPNQTIHQTIIQLRKTAAKLAAEQRICLNIATQLEMSVGPLSAPALTKKQIRENEIRDQMQTLRNKRMRVTTF